MLQLHINTIKSVMQQSSGKSGGGGTLMTFVHRTDDGDLSVSLHCVGSFVASERKNVRNVFV